MDISELAHIEGNTGWTHLHRLARCDVRDLPDDSKAFFADFAQALLAEKKLLRYDSRKKFNDTIRELAVDRLKVLETDAGRVPINKMSPTEFYKSSCWKWASAVHEELRSNELHTIDEAIEQVVANTNEEIGIRTVERAWKDAKKFKFSGLTHHIYPTVRAEAQKRYIVEYIVKYLHTKKRLPSQRCTAEIPPPIRKRYGIDKKDKCLEIATVNPSHPFKTFEKFDDWEETHNFLIEVLAGCVILDSKSETTEYWSKIPTPFLILIGESVVAKLDRRPPRKNWP